MKKTITIIMGIFLVAALSFSQVTFEVNATRENDTDQTVFITLTHNAVDYEFHVDIPLGETPATYLAPRKEQIFFYVVGKVFPTAQWQRFKTDENSKFNAIWAWVQDGRRNIIGEDDQGDPIYEVIPPLPFKSTHPAWIKLLDEIDTISDLAGVKAMLKKIVTAKK